MLKKAAQKAIMWIIFILYMAVTLYFLFFAAEMGRSNAKAEYSYNLEPFKEIARFVEWAKISETGFKAMMINVVGNIACFIPYGILLPVNVKKADRFVSVLLISAATSLVIESVQLITRLGSFDVDDIFLNTLGGVLGYLIYVIILRFRRNK